MVRPCRSIFVDSVAVSELHSYTTVKNYWVVMSFKQKKGLISLEVFSSMGPFLVHHTLQILASKIQNSYIWNESLQWFGGDRHVLFSCNLFPVRISVAHTFFFSLKKIHQTAPPTYYFIPPWFLPLPEPPAKNVREKIKQVFRYFASCFFTRFILRHWENQT